MLILCALVAFGGYSTSLSAYNITSAEEDALRSDFFIDAHGNVYRSIGGIFLLMTDTLVHQELAQRGLRAPLPPTTATAAWNTPQFINQNRQETGTNFALRDALMVFYDQEAPHFDNPFPWNWVVPELSPHDLMVSSNFSTTFLHAFQNDAFTRTLPFNSAYLDILLNNVDFYFSTLRNRWYWNGDYFDFVRAYYPYAGFYNHRDSIIFIGATREWSDLWGYSFIFGDRFARTAIHEVGHVLGLGESLAHLFEELYMGFDEPLRPGNWERDSSFDRVLLSLAGYEAFWDAAFTSDSAYGALWDMHLGHMVSFADLQRARGLARFLRTEGTLPTDYEAIPGLFYLAFAPSTPDSLRSTYITQTQIAVRQLNEFIDTHNLAITPISAVFDSKIHYCFLH